jgi:hypothetical protein
MSGDATWALQKALRTALAANAALTALLADGANCILDDVPESEKFPYITIGDIQSNENETMTELGQVHTVTVNCWASRKDRPGGTTGYEGRKVARDILAAVFDGLNHAALTLAGFVNTNTEFQFSDVYRDDADTYHGVIRFRVVTEPA